MKLFADALNVKVPAAVKNLPLRQLLEVFIESGRGDTYSKEVYMVRGWIMAELEARDPEAFDAWLDSELNEDADVLKFFPC